MNAKLNDSTSNTVHFVAETAEYRPDILTVRVSEYDEPFRAALQSAPRGVEIAGFTIDDDEAAHLGKVEAEKKMKRLCKIAINAGAHILIGPAYFGEAMREVAAETADGRKILLMGTNIRLPEDNVDEHPFPVRPAVARKFVDLLLIGRPYKLAADPIEAVKRYVNDGR